MAKAKGSPGCGREGVLSKILVLALDPSYVSTGYAVINDRDQALYSGTFQCTNPNAPQRQRANEIAYRVSQFAWELPLTHIGMEVAVGSGSGACRPLDRLNGAIGLALYYRFPHVPIYDLEVREWRSVIGFVAPKNSKGETHNSKNARLKNALMLLAIGLFPTVPFATVDAAEAALMGQRLLLHLDGTSPFVKRVKKTRKAKQAPDYGEEAA